MNELPKSNSHPLGRFGTAANVGMLINATANGKIHLDLADGSTPCCRHPAAIVHARQMIFSWRIAILAPAFDSLRKRKVGEIFAQDLAVLNGILRPRTDGGDDAANR